MVAGGVAGEFFIHIKAGKVETDMRDATAQLVALADERAADAEQKAGIAYSDAGAANKKAGELSVKAAQLKKEAEAEALARVRIEDAVAWRKLTKDQISCMGTSLAIFPRQLTALVYNVGDLEAYSFATDIDVALHEFAKWNIAEPQSILVMREGPVNFGTNPPLERGVVVSSTRDNESRAAALAVMDKLSSFGFDATIGAPIPKEQPTVQVFVQPRPEGPQGEAKLRAEAKKKQAKSTQVANH